MPNVISFVGEKGFKLFMEKVPLNIKTFQSIVIESFEFLFIQKNMEKTGF